MLKARCCHYQLLCSPVEPLAQTRPSSYQEHSTAMTHTLVYTKDHATAPHYGPCYGPYHPFLFTSSSLHHSAHNTHAMAHTTAPVSRSVSMLDCSVTSYEEHQLQVLLLWTKGACVCRLAHLKVEHTTLQHCTHLEPQLCPEVGWKNVGTICLEFSDSVFPAHIGLRNHKLGSTALKAKQA